MITDAVQYQIDDIVLECLCIAEKHFNMNFYIPTIEFTTKGCAAGLAYYSKNLIKLNPIFLEKNPEYMLNQILPHEIAHLVARSVAVKQGINIKPHGKEWKGVMRLFGLTPDRCHSMDTTLIRARKNDGVQHIYKCQCYEHCFSEVKHKRAQLGMSYFCNKCKKYCAYIGNRRVAIDF